MIVRMGLGPTLFIIHVCLERGRGRGAEGDRARRLEGANNVSG